jgi:hypothetical protein
MANDSSHGRSCPICSTRSLAGHLCNCGRASQYGVFRPSHSEGSWLFVDFFFVLSGVVITYAYMDELRSRCAVSAYTAASFRTPSAPPFRLAAPPRWASRNQALLLCLQVSRLAQRPADVTIVLTIRRLRDWTQPRRPRASLPVAATGSVGTNLMAAGTL